MNDILLWSQGTSRWEPYYWSPLPNLVGKYVTIGPSIENLPGGRHGALVWFEQNTDVQRIWVFGGQGYGADSNLH